MSPSCGLEHLYRFHHADNPVSRIVHPHEVWQDSDGSLITGGSTSKQSPLGFSCFQLSLTPIWLHDSNRQIELRNKQQGVWLHQKAPFIDLILLGWILLSTLVQRTFSMLSLIVLTLPTRWCQTAQLDFGFSSFNRLLNGSLEFFSQAVDITLPFTVGRIHT